MDAPSGTVTLLFTDIEGSTRLLHEAGDEYAGLLARHRELLQQAFEAHGGHVVDTAGDSFFVAFARANDAVAAAADAQLALANDDHVRVRMGIHTGEPELVEGAYVGLDVHRAARVMAAGHGGQVLVSDTARALLDSEFALRDLGEHRLKDLSLPQRLHQLEVPGLDRDFPPLKTLENRPTNLPVQATPLIGREGELREIQDRLREADVRLMTLTGPGGTGKTRLALQAAADAVEEFPDGVFFVSLAPVRDAAELLPAIAETLGLRERPGEDPFHRLLVHLEGRRLLLVLDNLEHLEAAGPQIAALLRAAPDLKVLATSRAPLRLAAEHTQPVPPLAERDAVRMFAARAKAAKPDFAVTAENGPAVAEICVRLDGLPLAIELAAVRVRALSPSALLARLDQRLSLLTGGSRDADERQQTLRATIEWSYELLSAEERHVFERVALFPAGCRVDAAEAVCETGDVLDTLISLVDKSLVRRRDDADDEPRFWMFETIREFALERLGADAPMAALVDHFTQLVEALETGGMGMEVARIELERTTILAGLEWSLTHDRERAIRLTIPLGLFWYIAGRVQEGRALTDRALALATRDVDRGRLLHWAGSFRAVQGETAESLRMLTESLQLNRAGGTTRGVIYALFGISATMAMLGDRSGSIPYVEEAVELARAHPELNALPPALLNLGSALASTGRPREAREAYEEALALARAAQDDNSQVYILCGLADQQLAEDRTHGREYVDEALVIGRRNPGTRIHGMALVLMAAFRIDEGDPAAVEGWLAELAEISNDASDFEVLASAATVAAVAALQAGDPERAAVLAGAGAALRAGATPVGLEVELLQRLDGLPAREPASPREAAELLLAHLRRAE